jgi:hypothetical protein
MFGAGSSVRIVGVDLGQQRDYTAISVLERGHVPAGEKYNAKYHHRGREVFAARQPVRREYQVRHLERPELGTPYPKIAARVVELLKSLGGAPVLVVDATGVGRPVVDMLRHRLIQDLEGTDVMVTPCWITLTGGSSVTRATNGFLNVPKRDLVSAALVLMQNQQLKIADALALKDTLVKELLAFRVKINISTAHDSYEAWREGDHDDLVLSVAMPCWSGERFLKKEDSIPLPGEAVQDAPVTVIGRP